MDSYFNVVSPLTLLNDDHLIKSKQFPSQYIQGIEDIRLYYTNQQVFYIGTSQNFNINDNNNISQIIGFYNYNNDRLEQPTQLISPLNSYCEKNWIPFFNNSFIYSWRPFTLYKIIDNNNMSKLSEQSTPFIFNNIRGSSNFVLVDSFYYGITHIVVIENDLRFYYHLLIKIDSITNNIVSYSLPFYFENNCVEYCLSYDKINTKNYCIYTTFDSNPTLIEFPDESIIWCNI